MGHETLRWTRAMRIEFDRDACTGHGRCYALAPEVFQPDDNGYCLDPSGPVADRMEAAALRGADNCPERAITIVD